MLKRSSRSAIEELREQQERFRLIAEALPDYAIFMLDSGGKVATWNPGADRLSGYRTEEIVGRHSSVFSLPEDVEAGNPARALDTAARQGRFEVEHWCVRKDGSRFWADVVIAAIRDSYGALVGFANVTRDISGRHGASEQFGLAIEAAPTGMLMVDGAGRIVLVNAQVEKLFGYGREELIGQPAEILVPERFRGRSPEERGGFFNESKARPMGSERDLYGLRKDGAEVPIEIALNPLRVREVEFVLSSIVDITERKRSEREREDLMGQLQTLNAGLEERVRARTSELLSTLKEREVLLQEVHHRVKNNLQVISSLINMQVRQLTDASSRSALEECQSRIQTIALIHERLYKSKDYTRVHFSEYARSLASDVFHATGVSPSEVDFALEIDDISLGVDKAIPCGLIMNELISNALKHAFPDQRRGTVRVALRGPSDGDSRDLVLSVGDDGVGMPPAFDPTTSESLGMQLVVTLVQQLDGQLDILRDEGTTFRIKFPVAET